MNIQRLRSLTTGKLHTEIGHVYEDLEVITGECGIMTHMIPRIMNAVEPWLRIAVTDQRFWDGKFDVMHIGEIELPTPSKEEREAMFQRFAEQPNPLLGKQVIVVAAQPRQEGGRDER